jgi:L-amino acid N-acyltransferase YncA
MSQEFFSKKGLEHFVVRPAVPTDALDLLNWRNDSYVRNMSRKTDVISVEEHLKWFENVLNSQNKLILMGSINELKIGMVRFDKHAKKLWEVSIVLAPSARGKKISKYFLKKAISYFCLKHSNSFIFAEIKQCNEPSIKLFQSLNFSLKSHNNGIFHYYLSTDYNTNKTSNRS